MVRPSSISTNPYVKVYEARTSQRRAVNLPFKSPFKRQTPLSLFRFWRHQCVVHVVASTLPFDDDKEPPPKNNNDELTKSNECEGEGEERPMTTEASRTKAVRKIIMAAPT